MLKNLPKVVREAREAAEVRINSLHFLLLFFPSDMCRSLSKMVQKDLWPACHQEQQVYFNLTVLVLLRQSSLNRALRHLGPM